MLMAARRFYWPKISVRAYRYGAFAELHLIDPPRPPRRTPCTYNRENRNSVAKTVARRRSSLVGEAKAGDLSSLGLHFLDSFRVWPKPSGPKPTVAATRDIFPPWKWVWTANRRAKHRKIASIGFPLLF